MVRKLPFVAALAALACAGAAWAADWPQWLGPNRDNISKETGLLKEWPKDGPKVKWSVKDLGEGFSAPSIANGRVFLMGKTEDQEYAYAFSEKDGARIWKVDLGEFAKNPKGDNNDHPGPRGTPTVVGDKIYLLHSGGNLACLEAANGKTVWQKNLQKTFAGKPGKWAYAESPLIDGDRLIVSPGGASATVVALNKNDGSTIWKCAVPGGDAAAYASPIRIEVGGIKQYVSYLGGGIVGVSADDGQFLWRIKDATTKAEGINIPTPLFHDDIIFYANGYGTGGGAFKLTAEKGKVQATKVYKSAKLESRIGGYFRVGDYVYGVTSTGNKLYCVEFATGKIVWENPCVGIASLCIADGMLYLRGHDSRKVALVEASPTGYKEHGLFNQPKPANYRHPAWPYPVVANGCLYLRDGPLLFCYDVRDAE